LPFLEPQLASDKIRVEEDEYWQNFDKEVENGVGCRCRCDTDITEVEFKEGSCLAEWVDVAGGWVTP
jgi:mannosyltransferase